MSDVLRIYTYDFCISVQKESNNDLKYVKIFANFTFIDYTSSHTAVIFDGRMWLYDELQTTHCY